MGGAARASTRLLPIHAVMVHPGVSQRYVDRTFQIANVPGDLDEGQAESGRLESSIRVLSNEAEIGQGSQPRVIETVLVPLVSESVQDLRQAAFQVEAVVAPALWKQVS